MDWQARFGQVLGLKVVQLTGDDDSEGLDDLEAADVICSTPEKFGELSCTWLDMAALHGPCRTGLLLRQQMFAKPCRAPQRHHVLAQHSWNVHLTSMRMHALRHTMYTGKCLLCLRTDQVTRKVAEKGSMGFFGEVRTTRLAGTAHAIPHLAPVSPCMHCTRCSEYLHRS